MLKIHEHDNACLRRAPPHARPKKGRSAGPAPYFFSTKYQPAIPIMAAQLMRTPSKSALARLSRESGPSPLYTVSPFPSPISGRVVKNLLAH